MAKINVESGGTILSTGLLQLSGGAAMSTTLRSVTDQNNTASQLKLATNLTQVAGTLQIALDGGSYIDAQDVSGIDRFNVNRSAGSQQVNVDFSSNPTSGTDAVGALRTYANGVALSEAMTFLRNGNVGVGTNAPTKLLSLGTTGKTGEIGLNRTSDGALVGTLTGDNSGLKLSSGAILFMGNNGFNTISTSGVNLGAMWGIRGSGSTSATTSLLVQNSAGSNALQVQDNLNTTLGGSLQLLNGNTYIANQSSTIVFAAVNTATADLHMIPGRQMNINNTGSYTAQASALLQVDSTTKGFLPPRMTNAQRAAIAAPAVGLMVYCTDAVEGLYIYKSTGWTFVI